MDVKLPDMRCVEGARQLKADAAFVSVSCVNTFLRMKQVTNALRRSEAQTRLPLDQSTDAVRRLERSEQRDAAGHLEVLGGAAGTAWTD